MNYRSGCAFILFLIIVFCVIMVNTRPLTNQEREEYRAYKARKKIEEQLDVVNELAKMEISRPNATRFIQSNTPAAHQPAPSLPPSTLGR